MFKVLRKLVIGLLLLGVVGTGGGIAYHYLSNPATRRHLAQRSEEIREDLKEVKKQFAWTGTAVVTEALKGDRVTVDLEASRKVVVRLAGIDAPELPPDRFHKGQPLAEASRDHLAELVQGKAVEMAIVGTDAAKHPLALLTLDGTLVNVKMVEAGLAEGNGEAIEALPAKLRHALENAEWAAKGRRLGIWGLTNYVRPVEFRIRHNLPAK